MWDQSLSLPVMTTIFSPSHTFAPLPLVGPCTHNFTRYNNIHRTRGVMAIKKNIILILSQIVIRQVECIQYELFVNFESIDAAS